MYTSLYVSTVERCKEGNIRVESGNEVGSFLSRLLIRATTGRDINDILSKNSKSF